MYPVRPGDQENLRCAAHQSAWGFFMDLIRGLSSGPAVLLTALKGRTDTRRGALGFVRGYKSNASIKNDKNGPSWSPNFLLEIAQLK